MREFFNTHVRQQALEFVVGHGIALAEIAQGCAQLTVGTAVLAYDDGSQFGIGVGYLNRVLQFLFIYNITSYLPHIPRARASTAMYILRRRPASA